MAATHVTKVVHSARPRVVHIGRTWVVRTARPRPVQTTRPSLVQYSPAGDSKFQSITQLAEAIGLDVSFAARILRLTLLAPDIIETILTGDEPSSLSHTMLTKQLPVVWEEQRRELSML